MSLRFYKTPLTLIGDLSTCGYFTSDEECIESIGTICTVLKEVFLEHRENLMGV